MNIPNTTNLQYEGYLKTQELWKDQVVKNLEQISISIDNKAVFNELIPDNLLLGKRVERFVFNELVQAPNCEILLSNKQIQYGKTTIGELDCILKQDGVPIHLEIIYKFYLYDPTNGSTEIEHWVGPNRNDTLYKKLVKLEEKQFPLIYHECTRPVLESIGIDPASIEQRVCFKAQLYTPYNSEIDFFQLNKQCLTGFYIYYSDIIQFNACEFYIPNKVDWLIEAHVNVTWKSFDSFKKEVKKLINEKKAPLCWIKFTDGALQKFFVVWW